MSYILDALKKSEQERALGNVPTLDSRQGKTTASARSRMLVILLVVMGLLLVGSLAWIARERLPGGLASTAAPTAPAGPAPAPIRAQPEPQAAPPAPAPQLSPTAPNRMAARESAPVTPSMAEPPPPAPVRDKPLEPALRAQLPPLAMNVVSYSDLPGTRFVMINQRILREGQQVNPELRVKEITRTGALMEFRGRTFLLTP